MPQEQDKSAQFLHEVLLGRSQLENEHRSSRLKLEAQNTTKIELERAIENHYRNKASGDERATEDYFGDQILTLISAVEGTIVSVIITGDNLNVLRNVFAQISRLAERYGCQQTGRGEESIVQSKFAEFLQHLPKLEDLPLWQIFAEYKFPPED